MKKPVSIYFSLAIGVLGLALLISAEASADPSRYPQFAQQQLPAGVKPEFINLDDLVDQIIQKHKPVIIDVRSEEEYDESHIKGSISIPLNEVPERLSEIPKDKLVVFY